MNYKKKIIIWPVIILALAGLVYFFRADLTRLSFILTEKFSQLKEGSLDPLITELQKQVSLPPPLRNSFEASQSHLTQAGVITWTNSQRASQGLPLFVEDAKLNKAALLKAQDIFANQYFEHISPAGVGPDGLAEKVGYEFVAIGENLAMGNYKDDQTLVQAWMDSPGHRANILNSRYTQIGVAVVRGTFEGRATWMAVQEFGLPLSVCPTVDQALKAKIISNEAELEQLLGIIEAKRTELISGRIVSRKDYNKKVSEYNDLVAQYNSLVDQNKSLKTLYNSQVQEYNNCIK